MRRGPSVALAVAVASLVASLAFAALRLGGFTPFVITGRSMEPALPVGALTIVQPVDPATLRPGDVITYVIAGRARTHRVVAANADGSFTTKGDANEAADPEPLFFHGRAGIVRAHVPGLGYAVGSWRDYASAGALVTGAICLLLVLVSSRRRPAVALALARTRKGDRAGAIALLRRAVVASPLDRVAHRRLAALLAGAGDPSGAAAEYARFIRVARRQGAHALANEELAYGNAMLGRPRALTLRRVA